MEIATYNKKQAKSVIGYTLTQVLVKDGVMRLVFVKGAQAAGMDILCDPEGNGPGYADVFHA